MAYWLCIQLIFADLLDIPELEALPSGFPRCKYITNDHLKSVANALKEGIQNLKVMFPRSI